jgi:GT2 family glycosyltransferase
VELELSQKGEYTNKVVFAGGDLVWREVPVHLNVQVRNQKAPYQTDFLRGSCMVVPLEIIKNIGYFNEIYWAYGEDVDYCIKCSRKGYPLLIEPRAILWHSVSASTGYELRNYLIARNYAILLFKYTNGRRLFVGLCMLLSSAVASVFRQKRRGKLKGAIDGIATSIAKNQNAIIRPAVH